MNFNITLNLSENLTRFFVDDGMPIICKTEGHTYSEECLYKLLCPQFNEYFINVGIIIIISYIILSWLCWRYFKFGYKYFKPPINKFFGDMENLETRIYWDTWIRARISKVMLGYIAVVVWLSINRKI